MAQLYRRVLGLSDRGQLAHPPTKAPRSTLRALGAALLLWVVLGLTARVVAQEPPQPHEPQAAPADAVGVAPVAAAPVADSPELVRERTRPLAELGTDLASPDRAVRVRAFDTLRTLSASRVADVEARLRDLRLTSDPPSAAAFNALVEVRHHMGFEGADNPVDLALGVRQLLGAQRTPGATMLQVAERLALLRGLEFMDSLAADRVMIGFFQRGWSVWQWEARHVVGRRGLRMLPALIEGRSAGNPEVRRWAVGSIRRLGVDSVGAAVQMAPPAQLPDVLRAYASLSDLNAMPAVITFVDHPDAAVRDASREATASYERNAIWQLRLAYRNKLGENADLAWSWQTTMQRLFDGLDARRLGPANELLAEGLEAARRGDWETMRERYDRALRREPLLPRRSEMAAGYVAEATQRLDALTGTDDAPAVDAALTLLRRAVRLAPEHPEVSTWRATVAFHEAERMRQLGVLDEGAYEAVLVARPDHAGAAAVLADIEDGGVGEVEPSGSLLAAQLLTLLGILLLLPYGRLQPLAQRARSTAATAAARAWGLAQQRAPVRASTVSDADSLPSSVSDSVSVSVTASVSVSVSDSVSVSASASDSDSVSVSDSASDSDSVSVSDSVSASASDSDSVSVSDSVSDSASVSDSVSVSGPASVRPSPRDWLTSTSQRLQPLHRAARRVGFFLRSLALLPKRAGSAATPAHPSRARQHAERLFASASARVPAFGQVAARVRRPRLEAASRKVRRKLPSLVELRSTLAMLASSEPPQLSPSAEPQRQRALMEPEVVPAPATVATLMLEHALDVDRLASSHDAELDELLFGDSEPGLDTADEQLAQPMSPLAAHDLFVALAQLSHDTSPGLLEAPDTLPG